MRACVCVGSFVWWYCRWGTNNPAQYHFMFEALSKLVMLLDVLQADPTCVALTEGGRYADGVAC